MSSATLAMVQYQISMVFILAFLLLSTPRRYSLLASVGGCLLCLACTFVLDYAYFYAPWAAPLTLLHTCVEILLVQGLAFVLCRFRDWRALFNGFTAAAYVLAGNTLFSVAYSITGSPWLSLAVQVLIHGGLLTLFALRLRKNFQKELEDKNIPWGRLCVIPALFYLIVYSLFLLPEEQWPALYLPLLLILTLMALSYVVIVELFSQWRQHEQLQRDNDSLETCATRLRHEAEHIRASENGMALFRHDLRHRANLILLYLSEGDTERIRGLVDEGFKRLDTMTPKFYCENVTMNAVFSDYAARAQKENVDFRCTANLPITLQVDEFEYAIVVENLLENALDAAAQVPEPEPRFVEVRATRIKEQSLLEVSNSFHGTVILCDDGCLPQTTKGNGHGCGMRSVKVFAEKNNAIFDCTTEDGVFCVRLLMNLVQKPAER